MDKNQVPCPVNVCQACQLTYPEPPPWGVTSFPRVHGARQAHRPEESGPQHLEAKQELQPAPTAHLLPWLHLLTASPPSFACRPSCELYLPIGRHLLCRGPRPSRTQPATGLPKLPGLRPLVEKWLRPPRCTVPRQAGRSRPHPSSRMKARLAAVHCRPGWCAGLWTQPLGLPPGPADGATPAVAS